MSKPIKGGIYLVANGGMDPVMLMNKLEQALQGGITIIQLYNITDDTEPTLSNINQICQLAHSFDVPVLINNHWYLLDRTLLDGVHFDKIPTDYAFVERSIQKDFLKGITCTNDLEIIEWADKKHFDYVSFCSMFPSPSADSCEIVSFETIQKARKITQMPIFLAGGLNRETLPKISALPFDGIALISAIMSADDITASARYFKKELHNIQNHES